jgi:GMP synthase (glutamine-hydrolysing)
VCFGFIFGAMKPFLLLQHRYLDYASQNEYEAVLRYSGLTPDQIHRVRIEKESIGEINLEDYSGIILGGGPANVSDDEQSKKPEQLRFESELSELYDQVFANDFPYLGMCYGMGSVSSYLDGKVSKEKYGEPVGAVTIILNETENDPILDGIPREFRAMAGHKESCTILPDECVVLASSETCPYHMIRYKKNIYATQFHPELDLEGIALRIDLYRDHGYFKPEDADALIQSVMGEEIIYPQKILKNFVDRFQS